MPCYVCHARLSSIHLEYKVLDFLSFPKKLSLGSAVFGPPHIQSTFPLYHFIHLYRLLTDIPLRLSKHNFIMASPLFNERFIILTIDEDKNPIEVVDYRTPKATYLGACICLAVAACKTPKARAFFENYAEEFCSHSSYNWHENKSKEELYDTFWTIFDPKGCIWFEDKSLVHPDIIGFHHRVDWGKHGMDFNPQYQGIHLNGQASKKSACLAP